MTEFEDLATPDTLITLDAIENLNRLIDRVRSLESNDYWQPVEFVGVTSDPPTQGEMDAILGTPESYNANMVALVKDTLNNRDWFVFGDAGGSTWYPVLISGGSVPEAPNDGLMYARKSLGWSGSGGFIGDIGIGTNSPATPLNVAGAANSEVVRIEADVNPYMTIYQGGVRRAYFQANVSNDAVDLSAENNHTLRFRAGGGVRMTVLPSGNVGISVTAPTAKLHIEDNGTGIKVTRGTGSASWVTLANSHTLFGTFVATDLRLYSNSLPRITINPDGEVGIGTTTPAFDLDIKNATTNAQINLNSSGTGVPIFYFRQNSVNQWHMGFDNTSKRFSITRTGVEEMFIIHTSGSVSIGTTLPSAKLSIDQSSSTFAESVLRLNQADDSEEFIDFRSGVGAGFPVQTSAIGTYYGKARVAVNGVFKYIALYNS